jgi:hypothetical protein
MNDERMYKIQGSINDRQSELQRVTDILANKAAQLVRVTLVSKVILIFLGAVVATRETANQIISSESSAIIAVYALFGLVIAVVAGLEAAFKWETRSAELRILAAACWSTVRTVDTQWQREVGMKSGQQRIDAALGLLGVQDTKLSEVQSKAAELGVNVSLDIREL